MKLKYGIKLAGLSSQMALGAFVVSDVFERLRAECTITSANDSTHSAHSLHYEGRAMDFRTHDFTGDKAALLAAVKEALGENFDCVFEAAGTQNEHLHVEYDPKGE